MLKNVWIINHYAGALRYGMELRHYNLAKVLVEQGYEVSIISSSFTHLLTSFPKLNKKVLYESIDGITYCWIKTPRYRTNGIFRLINMFFFSYRLWMMGAKGLELATPDVIIASSPHPLVAFNGYRLSRFFKVKFIFEIRDLWTLTYSELRNKMRYNPIAGALLFFEKLGYTKSDLFISPLNKIDEFFRERNIDSTRFLHIPNGIRAEDFLEITSSEVIPQVPELRDLFTSEKFIIGYAGAFNSANALTNLIGAAVILKDEQNLTFVLIGEGPEKDKIERYIKNKDLKNVTLIPKMERKKALACLKKMDVLYNGSPDSILYNYGASPIKLSEYMMLSRPVLNASESTANIVAEAGCGICVPPENARQLADAILNLIMTPVEERIRMGENGHKFALNNLEYRNISKKLINGIES